MLARSLRLKRPQVLLTLFSLAMAATVASLLLNLYGDAQVKMTREFRGFGPNLILSAKSEEGDRIPPPGRGSTSGLVGESDVRKLRRRMKEEWEASIVPLLHTIARIQPLEGEKSPARTGERVVVVGTDFASLRGLYPGWQVEDSPGHSAKAETDEAETDEAETDEESWVIGAEVAEKLALKTGDALLLELGDLSERQAILFRVNRIVTTGGAEDNQVFVPVAHLQQALGLEGKFSLVELRIAGKAEEVEAAAEQIAAALPSVEVRRVREIIFSEGRVLETVRWFLLSLTLIILALTGLCLLATITAILLERRREVGLMKALGASDGLLTGFFLMEVGLLAVAGGGVGFAAGAGLAKLLGLRLFGVPLDVHWPALPWVLLATLGVALLAAWAPLRVVRRIQPAMVLKGE
ncbi:MAG: FtsX-like permease family protein [Acidobacteria bacterium]|nr:FtsX-like permease family protein [Acidobacteriota bacterium]